jgi:hypothetical protein
MAGMYSAVNIIATDVAVIVRLIGLGSLADPLPFIRLAKYAGG